MTDKEAKDFLTHFICSCPYGTSPTNCGDDKCEFDKAVRILCEEGAMECKKTECGHYKVCREWYSLGNENYINESNGNCEHYMTSDTQIKSQMKLSELRTLLDNYEDNDIVQLRIYGSSDFPSVDLMINDNTIMSDEY